MMNDGRRDLEFSMIENAARTNVESAVINPDARVIGVVTVWTGEKGTKRVI